MEDHAMPGMNKFILIYEGGSMPQDEAAAQAVTAQWMQWFGKLGTQLIDGGFPFTPGAQMTDGMMSMPSMLPVSGYSIIQAKDYSEALEIAKGCPVTMGGAKIHVIQEMKVLGM